MSDPGRLLPILLLALSFCHTVRSSADEKTCLADGSVGRDLRCVGRRVDNSLVHMLNADPAQRAHAPNQNAREVR